jgi:hypothetical protein
MRRTTLPAFVGLAALIVVAAGCGGGSKSSTTTQAATTSAAQTATSTPAATTAAQAPTTTAATSTQPTIAALAHGKCRDLAALGKKFESAFTGAANAGDLKKEAELLQAFAKQVPSAIRSDVQVVADYLSKVASVVGTVKPGQRPSAATLAKLQKVATSANQAKLAQAGQHIEAWVQKNCKA